MSGSAVARDDRRHQREAEAVARMPAGIACPAELIPDRAHVLGGNADAGVGDLDRDGPLAL